MDIGIIGAGNIGGTLARLLANAGHTVTIANSRGPQTLSDLVDGQPSITAGTIEEAAQFGQVAIEAVPMKAIPDLPAAPFADKIVISASNYYPDRDGQIAFDGMTQTEWVADHLSASRVVKAFNTIWFQHLADLGDTDKEEEDRRVIPLAGDDAGANHVVAELIRDIGFAPLDAGSLSHGGRRMEPGTPIYNVDLTLREARPVLIG